MMTVAEFREYAKRATRISGYVHLNGRRSASIKISRREALGMVAQFDSSYELTTADWIEDEYNQVLMIGAANVK